MLRFFVGRFTSVHRAQQREAVLVAQRGSMQSMCTRKAMSTPAALLMCYGKQCLSSTGTFISSWTASGVTRRSWGASSCCPTGRGGHLPGSMVVWLLQNRNLTPLRGHACTNMNSWAWYLPNLSVLDVWLGPLGCQDACILVWILCP